MTGFPVFPGKRASYSLVAGGIASRARRATGREPPEVMVDGRGGGSPAQLSHLEPRNTPATRCAAGWRSRNADQDSLGMAGGSNLWKGGSPSVATVASVAGEARRLGGRRGSRPHHGPARDGLGVRPIQLRLLRPGSTGESRIPRRSCLCMSVPVGLARAASIGVCDIESGKMRATRELFGAD